MKKVTFIVSVVTVFVFSLGITASFAANNWAIILQGEEKPVGCWATTPSEQRLFTQDEIHLVTDPGGRTILTCQFPLPEGLWPDKEEAVEVNCGLFTADGIIEAFHGVSLEKPDGTAVLNCSFETKLEPIR